MAFLCCCLPFSRSQMPDLSLSLVSSSNTFLNGILVHTDTRKPIYTIDTVESRTSIIRQTATAPTAAHHGRDSRARSRSRSRSRSHHTGSGTTQPQRQVVASVQWPERSPHIVPLRPGAPRTRTRAPVNPRRDQDAARVHLDDGSVVPLPRFLKRRSQALAGTFHKFRIPGYPATFKWKRSGQKYQLRATGIRSMLAELTSDTLTAHLELAIYGAFIPSHHNQDQPGAVASVLLDYIALTALLLVTPLREWTRFSHHVRSVGAVSSAWGDGDGNGESDGDGEFASEEWEEPTRFRWARAGPHRHAHGQEHERHQEHQEHQDRRRRAGRCARIGDDADADVDVDVDAWEATSDEMREVAHAALFTASRFARRRRSRSGSTATTASTDSGRTLVAPHPTTMTTTTATATVIVVPAVHTTGGSATHAQEVVRRALAMDLERDLGDYPGPGDLCAGA